jgi:uncharacterized protein with NAD-binding domain and iron-sulfur cluster
MSKEAEEGSRSTISPTRRQFIRNVGVAAAVAVSSKGFSSLAANPAGLRVAVLGGGVAGLTAAHELAERGYQVTVYERKALGGKARSIPVAGTGLGGRRELPGEHGFRFIPGFYRNLPDTLRRVPFPGKVNGSWDNLVSLPEVKYAFPGRGDLTVPLQVPPVDYQTAAELWRAMTGMWSGASNIFAFPPQEWAFFLEKLHVYLTSSDARRFGQWEHMSWWEYMAADSMSQNYQDFIGELGLGFVAARGQLASTRTMGDCTEAVIYALLGRNNESSGSFDRALNGPTNEAWIDPWIAHLHNLGVQFQVGIEVELLDYSNGSIAAALARNTSGQAVRIEADWFVLAVPSDRATDIVADPVLLAADPQLVRMGNLLTGWMTGIQFFLKQRPNIARGHFMLMGAPWAIAGLSQAQFWPMDFTATYGDGVVQDVLSVNISNWDAPGILYGKTAKQCTREEIAAEVLAQIRQWIDNGAALLPDSMIHSFVLDPAIKNPGTAGITNDEPLLINSRSSWNNRPEAKTRIPNLFLAGDHVRATGFDLASMETANESGRRAANALLEAAGSGAARAKIVNRYREPLMALEHATDAALYRLGLPNQNDLLHPYFP